MGYCWNRQFAYLSALPHQVGARSGTEPDLLTLNQMGEPWGSPRAPEGPLSQRATLSCIRGQWKGAECPRSSKLSLKNLELLHIPEQQELKVRGVGG